MGSVVFAVLIVGVYYFMGAFGKSLKGFAGFLPEAHHLDAEHYFSGGGILSVLPGESEVRKAKRRVKTGCKPHYFVVQSS